MLEGTSIRARCAADRVVSGALVSGPCSGSGPVSAAPHPYWRSHAQATSGDVQPGTGSSLDCERSHGLTAQLSLLFRSDRAESRGLSSHALLARDASLQELRSPRSLHRRSRLTSLVSSPLGANSCSWRALLSSGSARFYFPNAWTGSVLGNVCSPAPHGERGNCYVSYQRYREVV